MHLGEHIELGPLTEEARKYSDVKAFIFATRMLRPFPLEHLRWVKGIRIKKEHYSPGSVRDDVITLRIDATEKTAAHELGHVLEDLGGSIGFGSKEYREWQEIIEYEPVEFKQIGELRRLAEKESFPEAYAQFILGNLTMKNAPLKYAFLVKLFGDPNQLRRVRDISLEDFWKAKTKLQKETTMPHLGTHLDQATEILAKIKKPDEHVDLEQFRMGLKVEEEHGPTMHDDLDVTGGDPIKTGKIALAHLREDPQYYTFLAEMEEQGKIRMVQKIVEEGGGEWVGMQDRTVLGKPPLVLFLDPQTKTTLLVDPLQMEVTPETVRQRIQQSRAQFGAVEGG